MKIKILLTILFVCVFMLGFAGIGTTTVYAAESGTCGENLTWTLDADGVLTISGSEAMTDYSSSEFAPWDKTSVKSVVIESGVTSIGAYAFYGCTELTTVTIPSGVTTIGKYAFRECEKLSTVTISDGVTSIGEHAFWLCKGLTTVTIPGSVTTIEGGAFNNCTGLTALTISKGVETIGNAAFFNCTSLTALNIPDSVTSIGQNAFGYCTGITAVTIPASVTSVADYAFKNCSNLTSVTFEDAGAPTLGDEVFEGVSSDFVILVTEGAAVNDSISGSGYNIHYHSWDAAWSADTTHHWHECSVDGCPVTDNSAKGGYAEHTFDATDLCSCGIANWSYPTSAPTTYFDSGEGTEDKPYIIKTAQQLANLAYWVNSGNATAGTYYQLGANIDLGLYQEWTPIGTREHKFAGIFDGNNYNNYKVSNLAIGSESAPAQNSSKGLFGYVGQNGVVKNLTVSGAVYTGFSGAGGIAGYAEYAQFSNCYSDVTVVSTYNNVGGIVGQAYQTTFENCHNMGNVVGQYYVGGIVGAFDTSTMKNCSNSGAVTGTKECGGIIGSIYNGTLENCSNTGAISAKDSLGGIVGSANFPTSGSIVNCYNTASVTGTGEDVGGLAGYISFGSMINCYNTGAVTASTNIGGLVGNLSSSATVKICYNTGAVSATATNANCGTLVGKASGSVENCFALAADNIGVRGDASEGSASGIDTFDDHNDTVYYGELERTLAAALSAAVLNSNGSYTGWTADSSFNGGYPTLLTTAHSLTYQVSGAVITESCTCGCGHTATMTLTAPDNLVYDGDEKSVSTIYTPNWIGAASGTLTYSTTDLVNAGSVTATFTWSESKVATLTYTITPGVVSPTVMLEQSDYTYTGSAITPTVKVYDGDILLTEGTDYTVQITDNLNVGTATVTIVDVSGNNYNVSGSTTFNIVPATFPDLGVQNTSSIYIGNPQVAYISATRRAPDMTQITYLYSTTEGGPYTATPPSYTDVGEYTIYYQATNPNYKTLEGSFTFTVYPADISLWIQQDGTLTYNGQPQTPAIQAIADTKGNQPVTYTYSASENGVYSSQVPALTEAGTYWIYFKATAPNHSEYAGTLRIIIAPKPVTATIELDTDSFVYDGTAKQPTVTVKDGDIVIPESEYTVEITNNINAGTATVTVTDNSGGNYTVSGTGTFTITNAAITNVSVSQTGTLTYTGEAQTPTVNANATTVDGAEVTFTYCDTEDGTYTAELPTFTNAGTYTVYFKANAERHEETGGSFEVVVNKATNTWEEAPDIVGWTYGENGNEPTATAKYGNVNSESFSYRAKDTDEWNNSPPTDAGIYELRARVQASDNWELLETIIEFEVAKADPTADIFDFTPPTNLDVCDGLAKEATVTVKEAIEGVGSVTVKYVKDGVELTGAPTTVGTYTVKIEVAEGANYNSATLTDEAWTFTFDVTDGAAHTNVTLSSNGNGTHNKVCSACEKVIESNITCSGTTTDDCDKGYKCSCSGYFGTKEHDFSGEYLSDSEGHWHECADCGATDTKTAHTPENDDGNCLTEVRCSICNAVTTHANETHTGGTATCQAKANCSVCGTEYGELAPDGHTSIDVKYEANNNGTHTQKQTCCDAVIASDEACSGGTVTCTAKAVCEHCGASYGELSPHTSGIAACTEKASCIVCGTETGEALGHDFRGIDMNETEHWSKCNRCDATGEKQAHTIDGGLCTVCEYQPPNAGLSGGAIAAIVVASVTVLGGGGFAIYWFVFKKKRLI